VIADVLIPTTLDVGTHTIILAGALGSAVFTIDVVAAGSGTSGGGSGGGGSGGGGLANTGVNVEYGFVIGLLLLVAGGALIGGVRLRGRRVTE
jgi:hypothetical protein